MEINYDILKNLLKHNKNMKLKFREDTNILDVFIYTEVLLTLELPNNNIEQHSEIIYNSITSLYSVTMYIPKIYVKDN